MIIDPLVLCGEIVNEVSIPQNLVHMFMVVAQVLARSGSSCHRQVVCYLWQSFSLFCSAQLTGTEFTSKCANRSNHVNEVCKGISMFGRFASFEMCLRHIREGMKPDNDARRDTITTHQHYQKIGTDTITTLSQGSRRRYHKVTVDTITR